jgi:hypothetical protein
METETLQRQERDAELACVEVQVVLPFVAARPEFTDGGGYGDDLR